MDIFFLRNPDNSTKQTTITYHASGSPEIWDPWTGAVQRLAVFHRSGETTDVAVHLEPYGSVVIVFRQHGTVAESAVDISKEVEPVTQLGIGKNGWEFHGVGIGPGSKPETIDMEMPSLTDWSTNERLKNFSGRGTYTTTLTVPAGMTGKDSQLILDLGDVKDVAQVAINGRPGPVLLLRPYKANVTSLLHAGENTLQITTVNTLFNALSADGPSLNYRPEKTGTVNGLMPAGLIGPVRLEEIQP